MQDIEELIKPYLQKRVKFKLGEKVLREGKLLLLNNKDYYIVFSIRTPQGVKSFEIPAPFNIIASGDILTFDYKLASIYQTNLNLEVLIKTGMKSKSKLYDKILTLEFK